LTQEKPSHRWPAEQHAPPNGSEKLPQQTPEAQMDDVWHVAPGPPQVWFDPQ